MRSISLQNLREISGKFLHAEGQRYRKIPKISPWAYIFQRAFFEGFQFLEGPIFGGAYPRREICDSKSIGLALYIVGRKFIVFALFYFVFEGNFQVQAPGGLVVGGAI